MNNVVFLTFIWIWLVNVRMVFKKHKIQKSLPLALITHNPVQFIMNIYIISLRVCMIMPIHINKFSCAFLHYILDDLSGSIT